MLEWKSTLHAIYSSPFAYIIFYYLCNVQVHGARTFSHQAYRSIRLFTIKYNLKKKKLQSSFDSDWRICITFITLSTGFVWNSANFIVYYVLPQSNHKTTTIFSQAIWFFVCFTIAGQIDWKSFTSYDAAAHKCDSLFFIFIC